MSHKARGQINTRVRLNLDLLEADRQRACLTLSEVAQRCVPPVSQASISHLPCMRWLTP